MASNRKPPALLLETIDENVACLLSESWTATLSFKGFLCHKTTLVPTYEYILQEQDLFQLTRRIWKGYIFRFDPIKFPVAPGGFANNSNSYKLLLNALMTMSLQNHHCALTSNGWRAEKDTRQVACSNVRQYRGSKSPKAGGDFRKSSLTCDRKNSRGHTGLSMAKRTATGRPINHDGTCKANFVVGIDSSSFFMICGNGHNIHSGHPPMSCHELTTRKRLVPAEASTLQERAAIANVRPGQTAAMVQLMCGLRLTRRQVAYCQTIASLCVNMIDEAERADLDCMNDTELVFNYLKRNNASYVALFHRKETSAAELPGNGKKKTRTNDGVALHLGNDFLWTESSGDTFGDLDGTVVSEHAQLSRDMIGYARNSRQAIGATDNQDVLLALAWMLPSGKRLLQAFPETLFIDGTHKTNKEGRILFTVALRDMNGNIDVVIRLLAPNERSWMFRWMFQTAIPALVGKDTCQRVSLIITDGDSQEFTQLDDAISNIFTNAVRRRCGWHIVKNFDDGVCLGRHKTQRNIAEIIKKWLYSWMKNIETEHEYKM